MITSLQLKVTRSRYVMSVGIWYICNLWILLRKIVIYLVGRKFHLHRLFLLLKLTEMTSTQESIYMKTSFQIPGSTPLSSTLTAKKSLRRWNFRPTRYITIFFRRIQRLQICKISTLYRGTLTNIVILFTFVDGISKRAPNSWNVMLLYSLLAERRLCSTIARSRILDPGVEKMDKVFQLHAHYYIQVEI